MLKNYLTIAIRNLLRSPLFSFINVSGMVLGITCSALILLFAWDELHMDRYHTNAKSIYRITTKEDKNANVGAVTPGPLAPELKDNFADIVNIARLGKWGGVFKYEKELFSENQIFFADNALLKIFDFPLVLGNATTALTEPNHLLLNETMASKYFGANWKTRSDIIGSVFRLNNEFDFVVKGVLKDIPKNSSLQFDFLLSFQHIVVNDRWGYQWGSHNFNTFVQLQPGTDIKSFNASIKNTLKQHNNEAGFDISTQPLTEMYLNPMPYDTWTKQGNRLYINIFLAIGLGILVIACFNFINLSTAQASKRAKEVGIRKTIGASRDQIFTQFLGESLIIVVCATLLSRGLIDLALPYFNNLAGKSLSLYPVNKMFFVFIGVFILAVGFLASLYPASFLSSFNPMKVLRGTPQKKSSKGFRETLVVLQFFIACVLMIGTLVIYQQLKFMQTKELGFDKEQLMYVHLNGSLKENEELFREVLIKQHEVIGASATTSTLVNNENYSNIEWEGQPKGTEISITQMNVDPFLIPLMGMKMRYGRNFSPEVKSDSVAYVINEAASKSMGFKGDEAVGKQATFWGAKGQIIGVVTDFHFRPLNVPIEPYIMRYQAKTYYFNMLVKIRADQVSAFIKKLPALYHQFDQENPLGYGFVDQQLDNQYKNEQRIAAIVLNFSILSIIITALGLFGLAAFAAEQRTKEIGIRKILGATVANITQLLSRDFIKLIAIAIIVATPVAWLVMNQWLQGFAYRIGIQWWIFALTGLIAVTITLLTVSSQAIKAAMSNPVESLRSE